MSEENVEAVYSLADAFNRRDEQAFLDLCDPNAELLDQLSLNPNVYRGRDEIASWFRAWDKVWDDISGSIVKVVHQSGEVVLWRSTARARGHGSGVEVSQDFWHFGKFKAGKLIRIEHHRSEAEALEAAGLSE